MIEAVTSTMDVTEARRRCDRIRVGLETVYDDVIALHSGQGWLALGYPTWAELCVAEFPLRPALQAAERQEAIKPLTKAGMPTRAIAEVLGVSKDTVHRDQVQLSQIGQLDRPERVESHDGKRRPSTQPFQTAQKKEDQSKTTGTRRKALPGQIETAGVQLRTAMEKLEKLSQDDRFDSNSKEMAPRLQSHLLYVIQASQGLLDRITYQKG